MFSLVELLELFFSSSEVVLNDPDEKFLEVPDLPLSTLLKEPLLYPLDEVDVDFESELDVLDLLLLLLVLDLELLELFELLLKELLLKPLLDLDTFDLPPLDLKLLELDLELDLKPELDLKLPELLGLAETVISPCVILSNTEIASIRKLEVRKTKVNSNVKISFLLFFFINFTSKKRLYLYIIVKIIISQNSFKGK
ncbi:hypothetical protein NSA50_12265 [Clostridium sp. DSM 100503]|uniref:hypothetical protein n=1 Tax=Clostridium sp. DSM 100503 TaxID=2963282 RepID=UPI00214A50A5|nr:hypothetical protein [Clostridium sp. DSM 100503]MCR1951818.1 hypothetical protein [Clostridium sp. DSM 100503]